MISQSSNLDKFLFAKWNNNNNNEKNPTKFQAQEEIFAVFNKTPQIIYAKIYKQLLNLTIIKYGQFWGLRNIRALLCWREEKQHILGSFWRWIACANFPRIKSIRALSVLLLQMGTSSKLLWKSVLEIFHKMRSWDDGPPL